MSLTGSAKDRLIQLMSVTDRLMVMALERHGTLDLTLDEWQSLLDELKDDE